MNVGIGNHGIGRLLNWSNAIMVVHASGDHLEDHFLDEHFFSRTLWLGANYDNQLGLRNLGRALWLGAKYDNHNRPCTLS